MNIHEKVAGILESPKRHDFIMALGRGMGIASRSIFTDGEEESARRLEVARECNEVMIAIWAQLRGDGTVVGRGYPNGEFISILLEKTTAAESKRNLRNAIELALRRIGEDE